MEFTFLEITFLENALIQGIFTYAPPHLKFSSKFLSSYPGQNETAHSPS